MNSAEIITLKIEQVSKKFAQNTVLNGFSNTALGGEKILLQGNNGTGKTTLLRMIAGLIDPDVGHIHVNGESIKSSPYNKMISWLPVCESGFWGRMTALEALLLYAQLWLVPEKIFYQHLESWKLFPAFHEILMQQTFKLSTGRRQLLHFCRLLLHQPKIILMDEPFRSLDEQTLLFIEKQFIKWAPFALVIWSSPHPIASENKFFHETIWDLPLRPK